MRVAALVLVALSSAALAAQTGPTCVSGEGPWLPVTPLVYTAGGTLLAADGPDLIASSDGGLNWSIRAAGLSAVDVAEDAAGTLWAATAAGIQRSSDGGVTWQIDRPGAAASIATDGLDVYALADGRPLQRVDGTWTDLGVAYGSVTFPYGRLVGLAARGGQVAVGREVYHLFPFSALYVRDAGTRAWDSVSVSTAFKDVEIDGAGTVWAAGVTVSTFNSTAYGGLFRASWSAGQLSAARIVGIDDVYGLAVDPTGVLVYGRGGEVVRHGPTPTVLLDTRAGAVGEVIFAGDALVAGTADYTRSGFDPPTFIRPRTGTYTEVNGRAVQIGRRPAPVHVLHHDATRGLLVGGTSGALMRLDGDAWTPTPAALRVIRGVASVGGSLIAYGAAETPDLGPFYLPGVVDVDTGLPADGVPLLSYSVEVAAIESIASRTFAAIPIPGIYASSSGGLYDLDTQAQVITQPDLRTLHAANDAVGYAGAWGAGLYGGPPGTIRAYRTTDGGASWAPDGAGLEGREVYAFSVHQSRTLAGTNAGVYERSGDDTWTPTALASLAVRAFAVVSDTLLAGTSDGLYFWEGAQWARYGSGLDGRTVFAILEVPNDGMRTLAVGTDAGVYATRPLATVDAASSPLPAPVVVYPNPARDRVEVRGAAAGSDAVLVDLLGRQVSVGTLDASGTGSLETSELTAGLYLLRLVQVDGTLVTRHITVVR